jgi:ribosome recycling factor
VKVVRKKAEEHKVAIRNIRHKAIDEVKALGKDHTITDDQVKRGQDQVQKQTDKYIKQIDDLVGGKEKEIMEV